jgi:hypothetical protein
MLNRSVGMDGFFMACSIVLHVEKLFGDFSITDPNDLGTIQLIAVANPFTILCFYLCLMT